MYLPRRALPLSAARSAGDWRGGWRRSGLQGSRPVGSGVLPAAVPEGLDPSLQQLALWAPFPARPGARGGGSPALAPTGLHKLPACAHDYWKSQGFPHSGLGQGGGCLPFLPPGVTEVPVPGSTWAARSPCSQPWGGPGASAPGHRAGGGCAGDCVRRGRPCGSPPVGSACPRGQGCCQWDAGCLTLNLAGGLFRLSSAPPLWLQRGRAGLCPRGCPLASWTLPSRLRCAVSHSQGRGGQPTALLLTLGVSEFAVSL